MKKTKQLQIRVSPSEKKLIEQCAKRAGMDISKWALAKLVPKVSTDFQDLCALLSKSSDCSFAFAELNDFLSKLSNREFELAISDAPSCTLSPYCANYLVAMIEFSASRRKLTVPIWTRLVPPLEEPVFASELQSVRLHLLVNSIPSFRRRNIFIDSSIGARV